MATISPPGEMLQSKESWGFHGDFMVISWGFEEFGMSKKPTLTAVLTLSQPTQPRLPRRRIRRQVGGRRTVLGRQRHREARRGGERLPAVVTHGAHLGGKKFLGAEVEIFI